MDLGTPFRGSVAIAAGAVTARQLRGPRFRRLFHNIYIRADVEVDLALRSSAAYLLVEGRGVLGGYSAAEILGASCGPADAPAEVVVPGGHQRAQPGLCAHRGLLLPDETTEVDGIGVTTPIRTAYDLACGPTLVEAVVAVDALAHAHEFEPATLAVMARRHLGARGSGTLAEVIELADPRAESPMETRIRLAIVFDGLPVPVLQHPVGGYRLDMAYPDVWIAIEYDGAEHRKQRKAMRDLDRQAHLTAAGWTILRFTAWEVLRQPWRVADRVRQELIRCGVV